MNNIINAKYENNYATKIVRAVLVKQRLTATTIITTKIIRVPVLN